MKMPGVLVDALVTMMPRIEASEALTAAQAVALGSGTMDRSDARKMSADWVRRARGGVVDRHSVDPVIHAAKLESMGIRVAGAGSG